MTFDEWKNLDWGALQKVTLEEIEENNLYPDDGRVPHVPFGFAHAKWVQWKAQIREGDELYYFSSSAEAWRNLAGREGYALIREGQVVDTMVTLMN